MLTYFLKRHAGDKFVGPRKRLVLLLSHEETKEFGSRSDKCLTSRRWACI